VTQTAAATTTPKPATPRAQENLNNEMQRLWFATLRKDWSSLVLVPAHSGGSASAVGRALAQVATLHKDSSIKLISAEGCDLAGASRLIIDMTTHVATGGLAIVVLDSVLSNPAGIPIALAADSAVLCVQIGDADFESSRRTVEVLGKSRFLGAVTVAA
jgi:hypothetical protein